MTYVHIETPDMRARKWKLVKAPDGELVHLMSDAPGIEHIVYHPPTKTIYRMSGTLTSPRHFFKLDL